MLSWVCCRASRSYVSAIEGQLCAHLCRSLRLCVQHQTFATKDFRHKLALPASLMEDACQACTRLYGCETSDQAEIDPVLPRPDTLAGTRRSAKRLFYSAAPPAAAATLDPPPVSFFSVISIRTSGCAAV